MADEESQGAGPRPGHFLPGGAGDAPLDAAGTPVPPLQTARQELGLGKARPVRSTTDRSLRRGTPLPPDPLAAGGFGAPPSAPLSGAPVTPLQGTRQLGGARPVGWHSTSTRTGVPQFTAAPPPLKPPRRFSKPLIAVCSVLGLIALGGGAVASYKLIDNFDNTVENPLARPSVRPSEEPAAPAPPQPTVTVTVPTVPDAVRVQKNELYTVGKVPSVRCTEPAVRPTTQANVLKYYQALLPCLNKAWAPLVRKAHYEFRAPRLVLYSKSLPSACSGESDTAFYCPTDETISMRWQQDVKNYKIDKESTRVDMMDTLAHEYGHHVQQLTNILISADSREGWAKTQAAKLEESRRVELQANCLGAAFLGANKVSLGIKGNKLRAWEYMTKHSGDEYNPKKVRDHGSRKNQWVWSGSSFKTTSPASCNTFTAPGKKVS